MQAPRCRPTFMVVVHWSEVRDGKHRCGALSLNPGPLYTLKGKRLHAYGYSCLEYGGGHVITVSFQVPFLCPATADLVCGSRRKRRGISSSDDRGRRNAPGAPISRHCDPKDAGSRSHRKLLYPRLSDPCPG